MQVWLSILVPSAIFGALCAYFIDGIKSFVIAGAIPWLALLAWLMYQEYFVPYQGGGASMWPIALLFAGTAAAATGVIACVVCKNVFAKII